MNVTFDTFAETKAHEAQTVIPFRELSLNGVKDEVAKMLGLIGRSSIFSEYTLHDIGHVDKMLTTLDWLIPDQTKAAMTPADWLLQVLAIYVHDLGMLVTDDEFAARGESNFREFCELELFDGDVGVDYKSKVVELGEESDRFLYQEYVRRHHAGRIADWIEGRVDPARGIAPNSVSEVSRLFEDLPRIFKKDLALVCASHHLSDIYDTNKYPVSRPYGESAEATANVQYAALILRSADLLHITSDRTPSVMFRLINPQDPVSQREWARQMAVTQIRPQKGRDAEGNFSNEAEKNTVEVFATYDDADAFFGLTSYLTYAGKELHQVKEWTESSAIKNDSNYLFPWTTIDTSQVKAEGFSPQQLAFSLDQAKILDLLTGHTLYNDTSVVLRELVQNAIDAVRLQGYIGESDQEMGAVEVEWQAARRELVVRDNGVGMTRAVIERNLLKAGASRYQEEPFRKQYPGFSPISRFGIGVLSAFMLADSVTVTTVSDDDPVGYQLTLRSVHGRYLVRLLDKTADEAVQSLGPHGTEIRLRVRKSAGMPDVLATLKRWVVLPRCRVLATVDDADQVDVGYGSLTEALESQLTEMGIEVQDEGEEVKDEAVRIGAEAQDGVETAFALTWSRHFQEWSFLRSERLNGPRETIERCFGTCIEGIRVEVGSPGFRQYGAVGLVNATGHGAPKTNVARVGIDATNERRGMLHRIYRAYLSHIARECEKLHAERGQSLTWAVQEAELLLHGLLREDVFSGGRDDGVKPVDGATLRAEIRRQPLLLVEEDGTRAVTDIEGLQERDVLWTVDSGLVRAAERLLREIATEGSLSALSSGFETTAFRLPDGVTLVGYRPTSILHREAFRDREVGRLVIHREERRVDVGWSRRVEDRSWLSLVSPVEAERERSSAVSPVFLQHGSVDVENPRDEVAVSAHRAFYLLSGSPIADWLSEHFELVKRLEMNFAVGVAVERFLQLTRLPDEPMEFVERVAGQHFGAAARRRLGHDGLNLEEMVRALEKTPLRTFDTTAWLRPDQG